LEGFKVTIDDESNNEVYSKIFLIEDSFSPEDEEEEEKPKEETSTNTYTNIDISASKDITITATSAAENFRYKMSEIGVSEIPYIVTIDGFDKANDKLTLLIVNGAKSLTTQEFDQLTNVEVASDGISGTQIYFAVDNNGQSGKLILSDIDESFSGDWIVTSYNVEILPDTNLEVRLSDSYDESREKLTSFNTESPSGTLNVNSGSNLIMLDGSAKTYRGLEGNDTYILSELMNGKISITDTEGTNTLQILDNTFIEKVLFTNNALRFYLPNEKQLTISGADKFLYNLGGNIIIGDEGKDMNFSELAVFWGLEDVLNLDKAVNGDLNNKIIISDQGPQTSNTYGLSSNSNSNYNIESLNFSDAGGTKNYTSQNDIIIPSSNGTTYRGLAGDDTYIISPIIKDNGRVTIVDTTGKNKIELIDGLKINTIKFASDATQLILSNGAEVTINGATNFEFKIGGNSTLGDNGYNVAWENLPDIFGLGGLPESGVIEAVVDQYII